MMKDGDIKFPQSANLFQFCRRVLDHKFGGIRVIDQDVGQILGFDPADCSHWKKGKKNIRSVQAIKSIADHLGVDENLVIEVATGDISDPEAFFEFSGYGAFSLDPEFAESAKKELYRKHAGSWTREREQELRDLFQPNVQAINAVIKEIHDNIDFHEAPLYIPEVLAKYPNIAMLAEESDKAFLDEPMPAKGIQQGKQFMIVYRSGFEARPYMRFYMAKLLATYFRDRISSADLTALNDEHRHAIWDAESNLFAAKLLTPANLIRAEMSRINVQKDIVNQLSDVFWVSKSFMNRRLKDMLQRRDEL